MVSTTNKKKTARLKAFLQKNERGRKPRELIRSAALCKIRKINPLHELFAAGKVKPITVERFKQLRKELEY